MDGVPKLELGNQHKFRRFVWREQVFKNASSSRIDMLGFMFVGVHRLPLNRFVSGLG